MVWEKRKIKWVGIILAMSLLAGLFYGWFDNLMIQKSSGKMDRTPNRANVLIMGVDQREDDIGRSDTMFVVTIDTVTQHVSLLSIPRDTRVKVPEHGWDKINHAYSYGGPRLSQQTVEDLLGIDIDYYIAINFTGFVSIIDAIGGIDINVAQSMFYEDPYDKLVIDFQPGLKHLDGKAAMQYVRYRNEEGDIGRVRRQQEFLQAVFAKVISPSGLLYLPALLSEVSVAVKSDMYPPQYLALANKLYSAKKNGLAMAMVPGNDAYINGISYWLPNIVSLRKQVAVVQNLIYAGDYQQAAEELDEEYILGQTNVSARIEPAKAKHEATKPVSKQQVVKSTTSVNRPLPAKPKVKILNGSGMPQAPGEIAAFMKARNFSIVDISKIAPTKKSVVTAHASDNALVSKLTSLPFKYSLQIDELMGNAVQVTVVIGEDYGKR